MSLAKLVIALLAFASVATAAKLCDSDELMPHPTDVSKYYNCEGGILAESSCPDGGIFNQDLQSCSGTAKDGYDDEGVSVLCKESDSGIYFVPHPYNCSKYFVCQFLEPIVMICPDGLHFDPEINICNYPEAAECVPLPRPTTTDAPVSTTTTSSEEITTTESETTEAATSSDEDDEEMWTSEAPTEETTTSEEPLTTEESTSSEVPLTTTEESTSSEEPLTSTTEESTSSEAPLTSTTEESTSSEAPLTSTTEESTSSEAPLTSTTEELTSSEAPLTSTTEESTSSEAPLTSTTEEITSSEAPLTSTTEESTSSEPPTSPTTQSTTTETFHVVCRPSVDGNPVYIRHPYDCSKFYVCVELVPTLLQCPDDLYFDTLLNVCNYQSEVECTSRPEP